jgi:signal transduction histidine kinase
MDECVDSGERVAAHVVRSSFGDSTTLADELEHNRTSILRHFREILAKDWDPGPDRGVYLQHSVSAADRVLSEVTRALRWPDRAQPLHDLLGCDEPALEQDLSFRISEALFDAILVAVRGGLPRYAGEDAEISTEIVRLVAETIYRSLHADTWRSASRYRSVLLDRVHEALAEERRSISRELHDRISQGVATAKRMLELYRINGCVPATPDRPDVTLEAVQDQLGHILDGLRALTGELRAAAEFDSVETAMRHYLATVPIADDQTVTLAVNGVEAWAPPGVRDELFLIVREATHNALVHSGFHRLSIRIDVAPHEVSMVVSDDGIGLPQHAPDGVHTGQVSMRERAESLGGTFAIRTGPGQGAQVEVTIPVYGFGHDG